MGQGYPTARQSLAVGATGSEEVLNCCNDYGKCTQGRNCPVRNKLLEEGKPQENSVGSKTQENPVVVLLILATVLCALALIILFVRT